MGQEEKRKKWRQAEIAKAALKENQNGIESSGSETSMAGGRKGPDVNTNKKSQLSGRPDLGKPEESKKVSSRLPSKSDKEKPSNKSLTDRPVLKCLPNDRAQSESKHSRASDLEVGKHYHNPTDGLSQAMHSTSLSDSTKTPQDYIDAQGSSGNLENMEGNVQSSAKGDQPRQTTTPNTSNTKSQPSPAYGTTDGGSKGGKNDQSFPQENPDQLNQPAKGEVYKYPLRPEIVKSTPSMQKLNTNHFRWVGDPQSPTWYRYAVSVTPPQDRKGKKKLIISEALTRNPFNTIAGIATDYAEIMITQTRIPPPISVISITVLDSQIAPGAVITPEKDNSYLVEVTSETPLTLSHYSVGGSTWNALQASFTDPDGILQAVNIFIARNLNGSTTFKRIGKQKYYPLSNNQYAFGQVLNPHKVGQHSVLVAVRGFFMSGKGSRLGMLINVNITTGLFWRIPNDSINRPLLVLEAILAILGPGPSLAELKSTFSTVRVATRYENPDRPKFHSISGFSTTFGGTTIARANNVRFTWNNQNVTLQQYMQQRYHQNVPHDDWAVQCGTIIRRVPNQPDVHIAIFIPSTLCAIEPMQPFRAEPTSAQRAQRFLLPELPPHRNQVELRGNIRSCILAAAPPNPAGNFLEDQLLQVSCQVLVKPGLRFANQSFAPKTGTWDLQGRQFFEQRALPKWTFIGFNARQIGYNGLLALRQSLTRMLHTYGLTGNADSASPDDWDMNNFFEIKKIQSLFEDYSRKGVKLIIVITKLRIPPAAYSMLKSHADLGYGIHLACIRPKWNGKINNWQQDVFANFAAKLNIKLGGKMHILCDDRGNHKPVWRGTMFMGIDTSHPGLGSAHNARTIAAVVGNMNDDCVQWAASIRHQMGRQEIVNSADMTTMTQERLTQWMAKNNGARPQRIVVYRDGVSEGQYQEVLREELRGVRNAAPGTPITFIIATKRHHTRFFPPQGPRNAVAGTVVDSEITLDTLWDFFLQSHDSPKGTAKSTRYVIIHTDCPPVN